MKTLIDEISGYQFTADINGYQAERFDLTKPVISGMDLWEIIVSLFRSNIPLDEWVDVQVNQNDG
jgi:hypothetical protein